MDITLDDFLDWIAKAPIPIIYFIRCGEFVKIGFSNRSFINRFSELQVGNPQKIIWEWFLPNGNKEDEKKLHKHFEKFKYRGEWYKISLSEVLKAKTLLTND